MHIQLSGHSAPVTSLAVPPPSSSSPAGRQGDSLVLASGSEDGSIRIWDVEKQRLLRGMKGFMDGGKASDEVKEVSCVRFTTDPGNNVVYASGGNQLYAFDLRCEGLVLTHKHVDSAFPQAYDEINQIDIHEKATFLALSDDSGRVSVLDMRNASRTVFKKFRSRHANLATCARFRPKRPWEVWSGGMDNRVYQWDFSKGCPLQEFETKFIPNVGPQMQASQSINPPYAYSLDFTEDGQLAAVGLGDGSIMVMEADGATIMKAAAASSRKASNSTPTKTSSSSKGKGKKGKNKGKKSKKVGKGGGASSSVEQQEGKEEPTEVDEADKNDIEGTTSGTGATPNQEEQEENDSKGVYAVPGMSSGVLGSWGVGRIEDVHGWNVTAVEFPRLSSGITAPACRPLISAGIDGKLALWELKRSSLKSKTDTTKPEQDGTQTPTPAFSIQTNRKVNGIATHFCRNTSAGEGGTKEGEEEGAKKEVVEGSLLVFVGGPMRNVGGAGAGAQDGAIDVYRLPVVAEWTS
ncbi:WD repeat-containing protein 53 [Quaeritorhiza haematococci]|nr:WD repeat-containing protein 53 [Quaeritorhiza haematococci]